MEHQIPTYETADEAVRAFMRIIQHKRNQKLLMQTPPSIPETFATDTTGTRKLIAGALADKRTQLGEFEAMQLLAAYGIPVVPFYKATRAAEAAGIAAQLGRSVALKIMSPDISHITQTDDYLSSQYASGSRNDGANSHLSCTSR
jgi:acetyltransferase